eukprot:4563230-Prorocentrum_lima.AAC.1
MQSNTGKGEGKAKQAREDAPHQDSQGTAEHKGKEANYHILPTGKEAKEMEPASFLRSCRATLAVGKAVRGAGLANRRSSTQAGRS